jgi:hypothetical protein
VIILAAIASSSGPTNIGASQVPVRVIAPPPPAPAPLLLESRPETTETPETQAAPEPPPLHLEEPPPPPPAGTHDRAGRRCRVGVSGCARARA